MKNKRNPYIDILKAIGIISIVIGHGTNGTVPLPFSIVSFVYTYHLMIFFFTAGYCFKASDAATPFVFIGKRLKGILPLYVIYNLIFTFLHNILVYMNVLPNLTMYTPSSFLYSFFNSFTLSTAETLLGAFWFLPVLLFAELFFVLIFHFGEKLGKYGTYLHILAFLGSAIVGIILNSQGYYLSYHMQTSVLALPIMYVGYFLKHHMDTIKKYCTWWGGLISAAIIVLILNKTSLYIELSVNSIMSPYLFYPVTFLGIYFCMCLAALIEKNSMTEKLFAYIGKNSFHIMALHFLCFKIVDFAYYHVAGFSDASILQMFPSSFPIWPVYYVVGTFMPLGMVWVFYKIRDGLKNKLFGKKFIEC